MPSEYIPGTYKIPELTIGEKLILKDLEISVLSERPYPRDSIIIGFMGSAGKDQDINGREFQPSLYHKNLGETIGEIVSRERVILSNGGVWGAPYFPIRSSNRNGGYTLGISPYTNEESHKQKSPVKYFDLILYAGIKCAENPLFDFNIRNVINVFYTDVVISIGGRWGTLNECTNALETGKIYIPIKGSGGGN